MPIYEYQCTSCSHSFEKRQGFDAEPVCCCPKCENEARRLFQPAPIIFKGSGFYVTDYNGKSPIASNDFGETKKADKKEEAVAAGSSEKKSKSSSSSESK